MAKKFKIEGIITALLTPLTKDEQINEDAYKQLIDFQIEQGIQGFFPLGTAGEGMKLSLEKRKKAAEIVVDHTDGRVPIILHVGTQDTEMTLHLAKHAKNIGVDAIGAVGPFFYKPDTQGLIQHYQRIGEAVDLPLFVYNNVDRQGYNITPETFRRIAEKTQQIAGLKDTSYNIEQMEDYVHMFGKEYTIIGAGDSIIFPIFAVGAAAHISMISNVFPKLTIQVYENTKKGDYKKARELQFILNELRNIFRKGPYITPYKEAMKILYGIDLGAVSSPLRSMTNDEIKTLKEGLSEIKAKYGL
ncbi:MAG: 4-hydroxy-tetrahydrodipicolinate synthase [Candidatus Bathyarchaeia archaeon]